MDFRYFGDMKIEEFVGEEAREAFAEYVINEEREIPSFMQQQIKDIRLIDVYKRQGFHSDHFHSVL